MKLKTIGSKAVVVRGPRFVRRSISFPAALLPHIELRLKEPCIATRSARISQPSSRRTRPGGRPNWQRKSVSYAGEPLMTVAEAAGRYFQGCSERYVRGLCRAGKLGDPVRLGAKWLIPENGILKFLDGHRINSIPPPVVCRSSGDPQTPGQPGPLSQRTIMNNLLTASRMSAC